MTLDLDPRLAGLGNARLVAAIIREMDGGVITFDRFMELALYHPEHGYYRRPGRIGPGGDFVTSPSLHPLFGWVVGAWCHWVWRRLQSPVPFHLIEPGAGDGKLASALLDWAEGREDGFRDALTYVAIEPHARGDDPRVRWQDAPPERVEAGVVVTNEFFDALPVKLFEATPRGPVEIGVRWDGKAFVEARLGVATIDDAPTGGRFEVSPRLYATMRALGSLLERGAVLTFDYGYPREELWAPWRRQGTLLAFHRQAAHENPYAHVGEQDLTAHVDFTALEAALDDAGFHTYGPISQAHFLLKLGAARLVDAVRGDLQEYFRRRRALESLTDGAGLGRVRVLAGVRGFEEIPPGFEP